MTLKVAPCSYEAAKFAVLNWHYSKRMPHGKQADYGVWEDGAFVGAVIFAHAANNKVGARFGLTTGGIVELVRVALTDHDTPVSQLVAESLRAFKRNNPGTRLVVSFADPEQNHHGGIYQAGNWIYTGMTATADEYIVNGRRYHKRSLNNTRSHSARKVSGNVLEWARTVLDPNTQVVTGSSKHRYLMPLDKAMRRKLAQHARPYPSATRGRGVDGDALASHAGEAGSTPAVRSLQGEPA